MFDTKFIDSNINRIWITSDNHFFHKRIAMYANRPDNHNEIMLNNWNSMIEKDDIVLHLGDIAFGKFVGIAELFSCLNGIIYLIPGNHDRKKELKFYSNFINIISETEVLPYKNYIFSHRPQYNVPENITNIHGHVHGHSWTDNQHINVCVENTFYKPVKLEVLLYAEDLTGILQTYNK